MNFVSIYKTNTFYQELCTIIYFYMRTNVNQKCFHCFPDVNCYKNNHTCKPNR